MLLSSKCQDVPRSVKKQNCSVQMYCVFWCTLLQSLALGLIFRTAVLPTGMKTWELCAESGLDINKAGSNGRLKSNLNQAPGCGQSTAELSMCHIICRKSNLGARWEVSLQ